MKPTSNISPVSRPKSAAKTFYDRLSRRYDLIAGSSERKYRQLGLQALNPQPGEIALEIGYGTGHSLLTLAQAVGPDGRVCGIDISEGMRDVAQGRLEAAGLAQRVELQVGDGADLPYSNDQFDAVFMSFTLELFDTPEIPVVLSNCRRVLHPDGRLALVTMVKSERPNLMERIYEWFHARWPAMVDCRPIFARHAVEETGFIIQSQKRLSMWGLPVEIILAYNG